jgi:hypothetical protein
MGVHLRNRQWELNGTICTIHLRLTGATGNEFPKIIHEKLEPLRAELRKQVDAALLKAFGPNIDVGDIVINPKAREIQIPLAAHSLAIKSSSNFERALTRFVYYLQDLLNGIVKEELSHLAFHGHWFPAPPLIRIQNSPPERRRSILKRIQQPLIMLLIGTLLGSALIPWVQSRSNTKRLRHDERVALSLGIIDRNKETNGQLHGLQTSIELFAKDHLHPKNAAAFAVQQEEARERFDLQYLAFDQTAWWWFWSVQMKSQLSSLATPQEAAKVKQLADSYTQNLDSTAKILTGPWNKVLRDESYKPISDPIPAEVHKRLDDLRHERDDLALQMAMVFTVD